MTTPVRYTPGHSSLGPLLLAATPRGVCALLLGDDPGALVQEMHRTFPAATPGEGDPWLERLRENAERVVEGDGGELPLDPHGSGFQRLVWGEMAGIPRGAVVTYGELARRVGRPRGARAVARACAANRIAVAVPCHRVIRADGAVAGYRWGAARKRMLLARERRG